MYEIRFGSVTLKDSNIISIDGNTSLSIIMDELKADELRFKVTYPNLTAYSDDIKKGQPILFYNNDQLIGKYYISEFTQSGEDIYDITVTSIVGIWDKQYYRGNYFTNTTLANVVNAVVGNQVEVSEIVSSIRVDGFLKYDTIRETLHQIMFATGTNLMKKSDGTLYLTALSKSEVIDVLSEDEIYTDGLSFKTTNEASKVIVTEHTYYLDSSIEYSSAFDNTDGQYQYDVLVKFSAPIDTSDYLTDGVMVTNLTPASCLVTGQGSLKVKQYTHLEYEISREDASAFEEQEISSSDCTLITSLNGTSVLNRLYSYYTQVKKAKFSTCKTWHKCGDSLSALYWGEEHIGRITEMDFVYSKIIKSEIEMICGYELIPPGNTFTSYELLTWASDNGYKEWVVPEGVTLIRVYLLGGGQGGSSGGWSESGTDGKVVYACTNWSSGSTNPFNPSTKPTFTERLDRNEGGEGGEAGYGGDSGKLFSVQLSVTPGDTIYYRCGEGGRGGYSVSEGELYEGDYGDSSIVIYNGTEYRSNIGRSNTLVNAFTGTIYGGTGYEGEAGKKGGISGATWYYDGDDGYSVQSGGDGEDFDEYYKGGYGTTINHKQFSYKEDYRYSPDTNNRYGFNGNKLKIIKDSYDSNEYGTKLGGTYYMMKSAGVITAGGGGTGGSYGGTQSIHYYSMNGTGWTYSLYTGGGLYWATNSGWGYSVYSSNGAKGRVPSTPATESWYGKGGRGGYGASGGGGGGDIYCYGDPEKILEGLVKRAIKPILEGKYGDHGSDDVTALDRNDRYVKLHKDGYPPYVCQRLVNICIYSRDSDPDALTVRDLIYATSEAWLRDSHFITYWAFETEPSGRVVSWPQTESVVQLNYPLYFCTAGKGGEKVRGGSGGYGGDGCVLIYY